MSWISLPVYEGFNQFAIWHSDQSVSKARLKKIMLVYYPLKLWIFEIDPLISYSVIYYVFPLNAILI